MNKKITQTHFKLKTISVLNLLFLFTIFFLFNSCGMEPKEELNKKIKTALRNDNAIDEKEWGEISEYTLKNKQNLSDFVNDDKVNTEKLTELITSIANKRRHKKEPEIFNPKREEENGNEKAIVNVFIENSGSMDGYVRGTTEFEAALSDLLVQIQYKYNKENLNINFINTKIYPSKVDEVNSFVETLEPSKKPYRVGNRSVSKLNEILEIILDSTKQNNISILTSDCIYSLDKGKDTEGALEFQKSLTKGAFLEKSKEFNFSTIVLKMNSKFDGTYYDKNNVKTKLSRKRRPYYFWIIGKDKLIKTFQEKINLKNLKGFENSYYLSNSQFNKQPFYTILRNTNKIGRFRPIDKKAKTIKGINNIDYENNIFQFAIAVDLENVPTDEAYLLDTINYTVSDGFEVVSVEKIERNKLNKNDFTRISKTKATHFITVKINRDVEIQDLNLELSNKIPSWVEESNSIDDRDVKNQLDKTFGLLYLVQGVSEAYTTQNPNNKSYFNINITIKK